MELKRYKLGEIGEIRMCKRILKEETNSVGGVPFFKIGTFGGQADVFITKEKFEEYKNAYSYPKTGDVLISAAGTIGRTVVFDGKDAYFQDSNIVWIENDESKVLNEYLFYCYKNIRWTTSVGSTILRLYNDDIRNTDIIVPPLSEQKKIASVLSALDDKIALNKKMNQKLEAMAKRLYDYWFVQYNFPDKNGHPYKTTGGPMTYNPTLKREIPAGWEVVQFQDLCTVKRGASPRPIDDFMDESKQGMPWVKISDATSCESPFLIQIKEFIIREGVSKSVQVKPATLIVSNSASPGIPKFIQIDACVHDGWLVILDYKEPYKYYLYYTIQILRYNLLNMANGSIFKNLKTDYLKEYNCVNPPKEVLNAFHNEIKKYMDLILHIEKETIKLTALRDKLLPLLMNGQVVVR